MALSDLQLARAARAVGTPLYAYSAEALRARVRAVKAALPMAEFVYSLKANPNISVVQTLTREGMGVEFCSIFELEACLIAGVAPSEMIFVGPAKSTAEIVRAMQVGVKAIIAESLDEIDQIARVSTDLGVRQAVALRINPAFHVPGARLSMSGKATQFGIDADDIDAAIARIAQARLLRLSGIHVYMGTRILDHAVIAQNTREILALADDVAARARHRLDFVDIGGGWGVPYHDSEGTLDLAALGAVMRPLLAEWKAAHPGARVMIELGRYMVAEAGVFVTAVRQVKVTKGKRFAICDGGSNCHAAAAQAAAFRRNFPIRAVQPRSGDVQEWTVSGPLCTPTDVIAQGIVLPDLQAGDLLRIDTSGAYGLTSSSVLFLSFGGPAEVMFDGDGLSVIRERDALRDLLGKQSRRAIATPTPRPFAYAET